MIITIRKQYSIDRPLVFAKASFAVVFFMTISFFANAQWDPACNWTPGQGSYYYEYDPPSMIGAGYWEVSSGGYITSEIAKKFSANCTVNWTTPGVHSLTLYNNGIVMATHTVTVACGSVSTPTVTNISNSSGGGSTSCSPVSFTITASPGAGGNQVRWYAASSGGSPLYTGTNFNTGTLSASATYYLSTFQSYTGLECEGARVAVDVGISSVATPSYVVENTVCGVGWAQVTASPGSGGTQVRWYDELGAYIQTGNIFETGTLHLTTPYYIDSYNSTTGCQSGQVQVMVTVNPNPSAPSTTPGVNCGPGNVTLSASASGMSIRWYDASENFITTASSINPWLTSTTTYKVKAWNTATGCLSSFATVTGTINAVPGTPSLYGGTRCGPGSVNLSGSTGTNGNTLRWYDAASGGNLLTTATSYPTPSISATTDYYASSFNATTGCEGSRFPTSASVNVIPGVPSGTAYPICGSGTAEVLASVGTNGQEVWWYTPGGSVFHEGNTYFTPTLSSSTTYEIETLNTGTLCRSARVSVVVTVNSVPAAPSASSVQRCGNGGVSMSANPGGSNTVQWYDNGGSPLSTANPYMPSVTATTTYRVKAVSPAGCPSLNYTNVTATVNPLPNLPTLTPLNVCGSGSVILSGVAGANGTTIRWYTLPSGGAVQEQSTSYLTPSVSSTTAFYATSYNAATTCESDTRQSVSVTVLSLPAVPTYSVLTPICNSGSTTIATPSASPGIQTKWYNGTNPHAVYTGVEFGTPVISTTTSWFVTRFDPATGCESLPTEAIVPVSTVPSPPVGTDGLRCDSGPVVISATPGANANAIRWFASPTEGVQVEDDASFTTPTLTASSVYFAASYNTSSQCYSSRIPVTAVIKGKPKFILTQADEVYGSGAVTMEASWILGTDKEIAFGMAADPLDFEVRWFASQSAAEANTPVMGTGIEYTTAPLTQSTTYYARLIELETQCISDVMPSVARIIPHIIPQHVKTEVIRVPNVYDDLTIASLNESQKTTSFTYMDGVGRVHQQVIQKASPGGKDIIQPVDFDQFGRASKTYLPYAGSTTDGSFHSSYKAEQGNFYNASNDKIANDSHPFATAVYEDSPMGRVIEQGGVGQVLQPGSGHTGQVKYGFNTGATSDQAEEVRKFNPNGTSSGFYAANILSRVETVDADTGRVITFYDPTGKVVVTKQQLDEVIDGNTVNYLETYYIYDDFGRVRFMIQPKGVAAMKAATWTFSQSIRDQFVFEFVYDKFGRLIEKKVPGAGWSYIVYDKLDRPVLMQDVMLRNTYQWTFLKYDSKGRIIVSGLYTDVFGTRTSLQNAMNLKNYDGADKYFEVRQSSTDHGYSNLVFPTSGTEILTVSYYDSHDFNYDGTPDKGYTSQGLAGETTPGFLMGKATGSKTKIIGSNNWIQKYVFYDENGRVTQVRGNNHLNTNTDDLTTMVYDFEKILVTKNDHNAGPGKITSVVNELEYDAKGRSKNVYQNNNGTTKQLLAQYEYNELGQMVDKKLHGTGSPGSETFLQSVDYRYTINGQLASINNAELNTDASNDDANDYFGMELLYNGADADGLSTWQKYNGNIAAMKWKSIGAPTGALGQKSYAYRYDKSGRLEKASYGMKNAAGWSAEAGALNESMEYDHNGNITKLQRAQRKHEFINDLPAYSSETIDNLTYTYDSLNANSLKRVNDIASISGGFNNGSSAGKEYSYDNAGNLTADKNKGIDSVKYNFMGKPVRVKFSSGKVIVYNYDASGNKFKQRLYSGDTLKATTDYVNGFVYESGNLQFFGSPEGRVVKNGSNLEYQYAISDHQGNTRVVFSSVTAAADSTQTGFETNHATYQRDDINLSSMPEMNKTTSGTKSQMLTGGYSSQVGATRSFKVYPGDKVKAEVFAKYRNVSENNGNLLAFATALTGAFGLSPSSTGSELNAYYSMTAFGSLAADSDRPLFDPLSEYDEVSPKGFITILLFDKNRNLLDGGWDQLDAAYSQTGIEDNDEFDLLTVEKTVEEEGYAYIFISNENPSQVDIHFDDLKVVHKKTNVIQYNEYYPFGLQASTSWTRENSSNQFLYNEGSELNNTSGWYDLPFRNYDAALGRFMQADPLAVWDPSTSPFAYGANNPIFFNDPMGLTVSATGYSDYQLRALYRAHRSSYGSYDEWAYDNVEHAGGGYWMTETNNVWGENPGSTRRVDSGYGWQNEQIEYFVEDSHDGVTRDEFYFDENGFGVIDPKPKSPKGKSAAAPPSYTPPPKDGFPGFPDARPVKRKGKRPRWKLPDGDIIEWDGQHRELERYNPRGKHIGVWDPDGEKTKDAVPGRTIEPIVSPDSWFLNPWYVPSRETVEKTLVWGTVAVGVGIIVFDIATIPSGEGLIGVQMIGAALAR
jgi:RHS repeat-associated protein